MQKNNSRNQDRAVALKYDAEAGQAPRVVAKGNGELAEKIKSIARQYGIPVHSDNDLVELLAQIDIDREIPPELYAAVAEVLSWIYRANNEMRKELF
ncbi:MAG: hypothetical protein GF350_09470 [Chitinivibrionales bacterium]|nr:hypothetical protein [Chitinivibrionales bacterium]